MPVSNLQHNPKSKIIEKGYINIYSELNSKERRQIKYKTMLKDDDPLWSETMVFLADYFKANSPKDCFVLDAGCGNGNYVIDENRDRIAWAVGMDAAPEHMEKNICLDEKIVGDLNSLPFPDEHFDVVISLWVLEHLSEPETFFKEVRRVLKKDGYLMFCTPNKNFLPIKLNALINNSKLNEYVNKRLFGRSSIDIFETFYKANTLQDVSKLAQGIFEQEVLRYNFDPSYTSFNKVTYQISRLMKNVCSRLKLNFFNAHIVCVLRKI